MKHTLLFKKNYLILSGNLIAHPIHKHYLIQLVATKRIFSKEIEIEIIDSNIPHSMINLKGKYLAILIDPLSIKGIKLKKILKNRKRYKFQISDIPYLFKDINHDDKDSLEVKCTTLLNSVIDSKLPQYKMDKRIKKVINLIKSSDNLDLKAELLYKDIGLSESHFHLLFKQNLGIPYRNYILFEKLQRSTISILNNNNFTTAAHDGNFSDSAHLSRTFKKNTGVSLSQIFKNKRFVQVLY